VNRDRLSKALVRLFDLVSRLRAPGGCPWDAQQTETSVGSYLLEEAYEALDAIERDVPEEVCHELGDLLFQIIFLASIGEDKGEFDLIEIMERIEEKMIRRHPHVFGKAKVESAEEVSENWQKIKKAENGGAGSAASLLQGVPLALPALLRAHRLCERASGSDFPPPDKEEDWGRIEGDFRELGRSLSEKDAAEIGEKVGSLLFDLANLSRHWGLNAEHLLRVTNQKFLERFSARDGALKGEE
jgi:MazG family protein